MASIYREIRVAAAAADAWDALRDYGAVHERVAAGFVTDATVDDDDRVVTFFNAAQARERLVTVDDERRRLVYTVVDGPLGATHHQASVEVVEVEPGDAAAGSKLVWITDVLPDELGPAVDGMMDKGAAAIARTLTG